MTLHRLHDIKILKVFLKFYLEQPTIDDMQQYSASLFNYTSNKQNTSNLSNNNNNNSDDEFDTPPVRTRNVYDEVVGKKKEKPIPNTPQKASTSLVPYIPEPDNSSNNSNMSASTQYSPFNSSNFMQMYKQNPVGMFLGANLNNCTININMPK